MKARPGRRCAVLGLAALLPTAALAADQATPERAVAELRRGRREGCARSPSHLPNDWSRAR